jgi:hypothetical protein
LPSYAVSTELIRPHDADCRVRLRQLHHSPDTVREDKIIGTHNLAVFGSLRNKPERDIVVVYDRNKLIVAVNSDAAVFLGIVQGDFQRSISTAIVEDDIFVVSVGLPENTLNALF